MYILLNFSSWKLHLILTILSTRRQDILNILTRYMRVFFSVILFANRFFAPFLVNCLVNSTILTPIFVYSSVQILSETFLIPGRIDPDILSLHVT
jgi:hypothetical protein